MDEGITPELCVAAITAEKAQKEDVVLWAGMDRWSREAARLKAETARRAGRMVRLWSAVEDFLLMEGEISGRLILAEIKGQRRVLVHSRLSVLEAMLALPMLIMDATLPGLPILQRFIPDIEIMAEIEATAPFAQVTQITGAPIASGKLDTEAGWSRKALRQAIIDYWVEAGCCETLVVCQLKLEIWLKKQGLPANITVRHFNAIAGEDAFKHAGLGIIIGRTLPSIFNAEAHAGALTGIAPQKAPAPIRRGQQYWYSKKVLGIRMADGSGHAVKGDRHPDPEAEQFRWQTAEAEVIQAIGRLRAANRTEDDPVAIMILSDLALPVTVDRVIRWGETGREKTPAARSAVMLAEGIVLSSAPSIRVCWPDEWRTERAAEEWCEDMKAKGKVTDPQTPIKELLYRRLRVCGWRDFKYQHSGPRERWRTGLYHPDMCPEPRTWLEARLQIKIRQFTNVEGLAG